MILVFTNSFTYTDLYQNHSVCNVLDITLECTFCYSCAKYFENDINVFFTIIMFSQLIVSLSFCKKTVNISNDKRNIYCYEITSNAYIF